MDVVKTPLKMIGLPFGFTRCQVASMITGAACLAGLAATLLCLPLIQNSVKNWMELQFSLAPNSVFTSIWTDPPMTPRLEVYVFNVTNHEAFLSGKEKKVRVEEIGPFVYHAQQSKDIKGYSEDGREITFKSKTTYSLLRDESIADDREVRIVVPNVVLFAGMFKPDVAQHPPFVKRNVVWPVLTSAGRKEPFLKLTVNEFLYGYEDELACLETEQQEQDTMEDFFGDDDAGGWGFDDPEDTTKSSGSTTASPQSSSIKKKVNYRRPDGRCLVGALERMNATWDETVTMRTGKHNLREKGRIVTVDGVPQLDFWDKGSECDRVAGRQDATSLPALSPGRQSMDLYMDIMCRSVRMVEDKENERSYFGGKIETRMLTADRNNFNYTDGDCFQQHQYGLKPGAMVISNCQEGAPMAFSFVHFMHADPWYLSQVDGVTPPDPDQHKMYLEVDPKLSAPITLHARFQLNIIIRKDSGFPPLANLAREEGEATVVPMLWAGEGFHLPDEGGLFPVYLALNASDVVTVAFPFMLLLAAVLCAFLPLVSWRKKNLDHLGRLPKGAGGVGAANGPGGEEFLEIMPLKDETDILKEGTRRRSSLAQMIERSRIVSMKEMKD